MEMAPPESVVDPTPDPLEVMTSSPTQRVPTLVVPPVWAKVPVNPGVMPSLMYGVGDQFRCRTRLSSAVGQVTADEGAIEFGVFRQELRLPRVLGRGRSRSCPLSTVRSLRCAAAADGDVGVSAETIIWPEPPGIGVAEQQGGRSSASRR